MPRVRADPEFGRHDPRFDGVRDAVAAAAARCWDARLVTGTAGNISARVDGAIAITPTGVDFRSLEPGEIPVVDLDGVPIESPLAPSSELPLHLAVYAGTDAGAIVHTHSPAATAVSLLVTALPAVHYYAAMFDGPVLVAPYHPFGTPELAAAAAGALTGSRGALLAHHGAVTIGADLDEAFEAAVTLEWLCDVYLRAAAAGTPAVLRPEALEQAAAALATYRAQRPRRP